MKILSLNFLFLTTQWPFNAYNHSPSSCIVQADYLQGESFI